MALQASAGCTWSGCSVLSSVLSLSKGGRQTDYASFAQARFTDAAPEEAAKVGATMLDVARLDQELQ